MMGVKASALLILFLLPLFLPASLPAVGGGGGAGVSGYHGWYRVFFMPRDADRALSYVLWLLNNASESIYFTAYGFSLSSVADALIDAHNRGVDVRFITDEGHYDDDEVQRLISNGIPVHSESGRGIMHNKFVVIDHRIVITGSTNWHSLSFHDRHNNMIIVKHPEIAERYEEEFMEMWSGTYHGGAPTTDPVVQVILNDSLVTVETYFAPDDDPADKLLSLLDNAEREVEFMSLIFTREDFADKLIELAHSGVRVMGLHDNGEANSPDSKYDYMRSSGLMVAPDGGDMILHHKVFIIDDTVWTGSMNPTYSGTTRNDENILVIHDPRAARLYRMEFHEIWSGYDTNITVEVLLNGQPVTGALVEASLGDWEMKAYTVNGTCNIYFPETSGTVYLSISYRGLEETLSTGAGHRTVTVPLTGSPSSSPIVINEFSHSGVEWIELYNSGDTAVSLAGYRLSLEAASIDSGEYIEFPQGAAIEPGQHLVVAYRASEFRQAYGFNPDYEVIDTDPSVPDVSTGPGGFTMKPHGDEIILYDNNGDMLDTVYYGASWLSDKASLPAMQPSGESYQRLTDGYDTDLPAYDIALAPATPGAPNNVPEPIPENPVAAVAIAILMLATLYLLLRRRHLPLGAR